MRGAGLILLLFLGIATFHYCRWARPERKDLPAVVRLQPQLATVAVDDGRGNYGLYQFSDGTKINDVIKLTEEKLGRDFLSKPLNDQLLTTGEIVKVLRFEGNYVQVERSWLSARHRMLLQIPLHPDRMTPLDWETLPGIGPNLARAIVADRQNNGDFYEFAALKRVKGIGVKKLAAWREYFEGKNERWGN